MRKKLHYPQIIKFYCKIKTKLKESQVHNLWFRVLIISKGQVVGNTKISGAKISGCEVEKGQQV